MARTPAAASRTHVDVHVGKQLALARVKQGINQSDVGRMLGLTFQQVQKYEKGTNRMSASVLWTLCEKMDLPITYFFEGLDREGMSAEQVFSTMGRTGMQMANLFVTLNKRQQQMLLDMAKEFSGETA